MPDSPSSIARSGWSAITGIILATLAVGAGWLLWREPASPPSRPAAGTLVLHMVYDLAKGPLDRRLLAPGPCVFTVTVTAITKSPIDVKVTLGPPLPSTPAAEGGPDPGASTELHSGAKGAIIGHVAVYGAGIQVLRVEQVGAGSKGARSVEILVHRRASP